MSNGIVWEGNCYVGPPGVEPDKVYKIGSVLECSLDQSKVAVDMTSRDSGKDKEYLPGLRGTTVTIKVLYELCDVLGQEILWASFFASVIAEEVLAFRANILEGDNNGYGFYFDGFLTGMPSSAAAGDKVELTFNAQVTNVVVHDNDHNGDLLLYGKTGTGALTAVQVDQAGQIMVR